MDAATTTEWPDFVDELDRWQAAGRVASLWWRDDDAVMPTPALDTLFALADAVPLGLAVIPALVRRELAEILPSHVHVLQHGWRHVSHAASGRKCEYSDERDAALVRAEIEAGRARLGGFFGQRLASIFVPPWNRMAPRFLSVLAEAGICMVSGMASSKTPPLPPGLARLDVHVDLTAWRDGRGFVGTETALCGLIEWLGRARREGGSHPVGLLTHHLVMDPPTASFIEQLLAVTRDHAAARWMSPAEVAA
jgi:hypothetical protein